MLRLTRAQVREIDRRLIEEFHIPGILLMESASRAAADTARLMLPRHREGRRTLIVCGGGNNGGDGLAIARHLRNSGVPVHIVLTVPIEKYTGDALTNLQIAQALGLSMARAGEDELPATWGPFTLVIDALFGTGLSSPPRESRWIDYINEQSAPVLAVDVPSGMDCDTGKPLGACVRAKQTITFVAEKAGFANAESAQYTGSIIVNDIGCPHSLIAEYDRPRGNISRS